MVTFLFQNWPLRAQGAGGKIRLIFTSFDVEAERNCGYDYVEVSFGSFSRKYCGDSLPEPITSTGSTMSVKFHSDQSVTKSGFRAVWTEV